jgi:predicted AlkP superfamily pyrophosphatase or phosphodiesterase
MRPPVIAAALALALGLGCAGRPSPPAPPIVVLVSIDGFRWDYLDRGLTPRLSALAAQGVRARAMIPVFPTKTFPNHTSIVTGRYPVHHGIVGNTFTAPDIGAHFSMEDRQDVSDGKFWLAEPIWVTAERQGQRTAPFFWPGSEAAIAGVRPTYSTPYDHRVPDGARVARVLAYLDLPPDRRPTFVTMYLSGVDNAGHSFGPDAPETRIAIAHADSIIGLLVGGIDRRRLPVDIIVVSDHGMAALNRDRVIDLDRYLPHQWIDVDVLSPTLMAWPRAGREDSMYARLARVPHLSVYRKKDLPARFHLQGPRVPPVIAIADPGWKITDSASGTGWNTNGDHGYDDSVPDMRAIFVARGPAFRSGVVMPPFRNIHLYALMASVLGLRPVQTDGSLDSVREALR